MEPKHRLSDAMTSLTYWHAIETFGNEATEIVIRQPFWSEKYPDVIKRVLSGDIRTRNQTVLTGEMIYEIAGRPECLYDFHADTEGQLLYTSFSGKPLEAPFDVSNATAINRQEALLKYGAHCLFKAADVGVGRKGE